MKHKIRDFFLLVCAGLVLVSLPVFLTHLSPIRVDLPQITQQEVTEQDELHQQRQQQQAKASAAKARWQKIATCEIDEDCIIVDKDPCGCLSGPSGVVAINALYTLEFDKMQARSVTKTCPDTEPSTEKECSDTAQAVCQANLCKIIY